MTFSGNRFQVSATSNTESPFTRSYAAIAMAPAWDTMTAVVMGSDYIRSLAHTYLPREPRETEDAWHTRVKRSVLSPFTSRVIETAAGMILRRPVQVEGDGYWEDFSQDVDGLGSDLNEFARQILVSSLTYGHAAVLVDYPAASPQISTLAEERSLNRRPYFNCVEAPQIWGWRQETELESSRLTQVRIHEWSTRPIGAFGEEEVELMRVIYPGRFELWIEGEDTPLMIQDGTFSLSDIPLVPIYSNRKGMLTSIPPLLDVANLNIAHYQRQADLFHALHLASMPLLVLEGWDENLSEVTSGVNYAVAMPPGNKAYYVQTDSSSFAAQSEELKQLEIQMSSLGYARLTGQKHVAESAEAKRLDRVDTNSIVSIISREVESGLQKAFEYAAAYVGIEPPEIHIDRDFDYYRLLGQDISALIDLYQNQLLTKETLLETLRRGEIIPDEIDIDEELTQLEQQAPPSIPGSQSPNLQTGTAANNNPGTPESQDGSAPEPDPNT